MGVVMERGGGGGDGTWWWNAVGVLVCTHRMHTRGCLSMYICIWYSIYGSVLRCIAHQTYQKASHKLRLSQANTTLWLASVLTDASCKK